MEDELYFDENGFYYVKNDEGELEVELSFPEAWPMVDSLVEIEKDGQGRIKNWTETKIVKECLGHPLSGKQLSKRQDEYTYYASGEIDLIDQKEFDELQEIKHQREIKHFNDGRPPKVKIIK